MSPGNRRVSITIEARNQASRVFRQLQNDINATNTASSNLNRTTAAGTRSLEGWTGALLKGRDAVRTHATAVGNLHGEMIALGVVQRGLNNALDATAISQGRAAVNLERLQVGLKTITGSTEAATAQYKDLIEVAKLPGINLENSLRASTQLQAIGKSGQEATRIIREFGNALALSSESPRELRQTIRGLSQLSTVGSILQEDLEIVTSRIGVLNRGLKELGGPRAEGIRKFYDALGVPKDLQGPRLVEDMLNILSRLDRAGNTASNSIENLFDTTERAQATIGRNFLPIIRETTSALEGLAARIEKNPELARTIALFETFAGTLGTVAVAIAGVGVALSFLGPALIATFTNPVGLAALAVGGLAAAVLTWKVATETAQQPLRDLNPLIERNTALIERNRRATEENNRAELKTTGQSLQDAIGEIQRRIEVIKEAGAEAQGVLARLDERLQNLQGSRGRQTSQLAVRVDEEFDDAFIAARGFAEELTKAESELQRLTDAAGETDAITDGFKEADQAAESLRDTIRKLGTEISEGASTDSLSASLAGRNVNPQTLLRDLVDVQDTLNQLSETYDDIASNAANSTEAQAHLTEIQGVLTGATERYLNALSQSLTLTLADTDAKESEFEEIQRLAQGYVDYYQGRGDAFQAYVNRADGLAERATAAIGRLDLAEQAEDAQDEAEQALEAFTRNRERAAQRAVQAEAAAARERAQSQRANLRLGEQLDRAATEIFKEQLKERTDANQDAIEAQLNARKEEAKEREAAADRVADREAQRRDDDRREVEKAEKEKTRIAERESRQRTRQAQREARELQRVFGTDFASGLADAFDSDLIGDTVLGSLRAVESDITAFLTDTFSIGTLAGFNAAVPFIQTFFRGLFESITRPDLTVPEHERTPSITEAQLATGQFGQTRQDERFFNEFGSQFRLGDFGSLGDIGPLDVNILGVPDVLKRDPLTKNDLIDIYNRYGIPHNLERTAENTKGTALNTKDTARRVGQLFVVSGDDSEEIRRLLRAAEDTPLEDFLANEQGLVTLFGAQGAERFAVGAQHIAEAFQEQARQQRRSQDEDFAFIDDLRILLEGANVPEDERLTLLGSFSEALEREFISPELNSALVGSLAEVFERYNIAEGTRDVFADRFSSLLPVWEDIRLSTQESAQYLSQLRDFLLERGVPETQIEPLIAAFEKSLSDGVINFGEGQNLFGELNTLLSDFNIGEIDFSQFSTTLSEGFAATLDDVTLTADLADDAEAGLKDDAEAGLDDDAEAKLEDGATAGIDPTAEVPVQARAFIDNLRTFFSRSGFLASEIEPLLAQLETLFTQEIVSQAEIDALTSQLTQLFADTSIPVEVSEAALNTLRGLFDAIQIDVQDTDEREIAVQDTSERVIDVQDTSEREIAVEDTSDRTIQVEIVVPTTETPVGEAPGTEGGRTPEGRPGGPPQAPAFVDSFEAFLADTRLLLREAAGGQGGMVEGSSQLLNVLESISTRLSEVPASEERQLLDQTSSVFESGNVLPETTEAFVSRLDELILEIPDPNVIAEGLSQIVTTVQMPVNLAEGSVGSLSSAIAAQTLKVAPSGESMPISGDVSAEVRGNVKADVGKPTVIIEGPVTIQGTVELAGGRTIPVRIENVGDLITGIDDTRATAPAGDFNDFPAG